MSRDSLSVAINSMADKMFGKPAACAPPMTKWVIETNPHFVRRLGKTGEECGELSAVVTRCIIQGVDAVDPASGKSNRQRLIEEMADVWAQIECNMIAFGVDLQAFNARVDRKRASMGQWEAHFAEGRP